MDLSYINRNIHEKIFPIEGIFLGISQSEKYTDTNEFVSTSGVLFQKDDTCDLFTKMIIESPASIPSEWENLGFNDTMTYEDAKVILSKLGFKIGETMDMIIGYNVTIIGQSDNQFISFTINFHSDDKYFPGRVASAYKLNRIEVYSKDVTDECLCQLRRAEENRIKEELKKKKEEEAKKQEEVAERKRQMAEYWRKVKNEQLQKNALLKFEEIDRLFQHRVNTVCALFNYTKYTKQQNKVQLVAYNIKEHLLNKSEKTDLKCLLAYAKRGVFAKSLNELKIVQTIDNYECLVRLICNIGLAWIQINDDYVCTVCNACETQHFNDFALRMLVSYEKNRSIIIDNFAKFNNNVYVKDRIIQAWYSFFEQLYFEFIDKNGFKQHYLPKLNKYAKFVQQKEQEELIHVRKEKKKKENAFLNDYEILIKQEIESIKENDANEYCKITVLEEELSKTESEQRRWNINFYLLSEAEATRWTHIIYDLAKSNGVLVNGRVEAHHYLDSFIHNLLCKISYLKNQIEIAKSNYKILHSQYEEELDIYSEELQYISVQRNSSKPAEKLYNIANFKDENKSKSNTEFINNKFINANYTQQERINRINLFVKNMSCDIYAVFLFALNNSKGESKRHFFDNCVLERIIIEYLDNNMVKFPNGDNRRAILNVLFDYYTKDWMYKVSINLIEKLSSQFLYLKTEILPYRSKKSFILDWKNVSFYDGYLTINNFDNTEYIKFQEFEYKNPEIKSSFSFGLSSFLNSLPEIKCDVIDMVLKVDTILLNKCVQKIKAEEMRLSNIRKDVYNMCGYWGGGGWPEKYGDEYVSEHDRCGHWRICASGKRVWVRACTVRGHNRHY